MQMTCQWIFFWFRVVSTRPTSFSLAKPERLYRVETKLGNHFWFTPENSTEKNESEMRIKQNGGSLFPHFSLPLQST